MFINVIWNHIASIQMYMSVIGVKLALESLIA